MICSKLNSIKATVNGLITGIEEVNYQKTIYISFLNFTAQVSRVNLKPLLKVNR